MATHAARRTPAAEQPLGVVLRDLASADPVPGGGAGAALAAATGAALVAMVAGLGPDPRRSPAVAASSGRLVDIVARLEALRADALALFDADADAYAEVVFAVRRPRRTDPERAARGAALHAALVRATELPLATLTLAAEVVRLAGEVVPQARPTARSDLSVGVLTADAAVRGAANTVWSNVAGIRARDAGFAESTQSKARSLVDECGTLAGRLLAELGGTAHGPG